MGGRKKNGNFWDSAKLNNATYRYYYDKLCELAISMFEWKNLPDTIDPRYLELCLFCEGKALYFRDDVIGDLALRCTLAGPFDIYDVPTRRRAYSTSGYQAERTNADSVVIYNNYLRHPTKFDVEMFAMKLYNISRAIDVNANAQKTPVLITCDEEQRLTLQNLYMQYEGNMPFIFGTKALNPKSLTSINTGAPYVGDKLYQLFTQYWNEALTHLGISNVNYQKKERMISDEVLRNQGGTIASRYSRLDMRRFACDKINKMFGTDIWVEYKEDYREADDEVMFSGDTGNKGAKDMVVDLRTQ